MTLKELKEWINGLPEEFSEFEVVNGEEAELDGQYWYRKDKPIVSAMVDDENQEVCLFNGATSELSDEDIAEINKLKEEQSTN